MLKELTDLLLRSRTLEQLRIEYGKEARRNEWIDMLVSLLQLAEYWIFFGWSSQAAPIVEEARRFIFEYRGQDLTKGRSYPISNYVRLVGAYIRCVSQIDDIDVVASKLRELLKNIDTIPNTSTIEQYFSVLHLTIVESLVLALVSDDFIMGETARRWLDEDEYLVRRPHSWRYEETAGSNGTLSGRCR